MRRNRLTPASEQLNAKRILYKSCKCCEGCGWVPPFKIDRENFGCLQLHHVKPDCCGGGLEPTNTALLCPNCHKLAHVITRVSNAMRQVICGPTTRQELLAKLHDLNSKEPTKDFNLAHIGMPTKPISRSVYPPLYVEKTGNPFEDRLRITAARLAHNRLLRS